MGWRADLQESSSATRGCTGQVSEYGDETRGSLSTLTYEVCAGEACTEHASEGRGPAGAQRRSQTWGWWAPAGQDTVETLKQAYFQGYPESAGCVQGSIDSRNSAIHSAYRISLRPSSLFEPRHPSLKVVKVRLLETRLLERFGRVVNPARADQRAAAERERQIRAPLGRELQIPLGGKTPRPPWPRRERAKSLMLSPTWRDRHTDDAR